MTLKQERLPFYFKKMIENAELSAQELSEGILDVTNTAMERAIRVISVERGYDPREFTLFSFGGAGGMHAAFLARLLSIPKVLFPQNPGILSAIGMLMANITGVRRTKELIAKYGIEKTLFYAGALMDYAERLTRKTIREIPDGNYTFEDFMDDDGISNRNIKLQVKITIHNDSATLDFSGCDLQVHGSVNAVYAIALSAVLYVFRSLVSTDIPTNTGCLRPIRVLTRKGTIVDARFPAAVAGGNVELSQRIVDVVLGALSHAVPDKIPAASQGTMNNVTIGGVDSRNNRPFAYYETIAGGLGASLKCDGESAVHCHMTNTLNTPVEALEYSYPFLVNEYAIRRGTGGNGLHKGGDGIVREIELISDAEVTVLSERRKVPPYGLFGGKPGDVGKNTIFRKEGREQKGGKFSVSLNKGDRLRIETPGGGGYGNPE